MYSGDGNSEKVMAIFEYHRQKRDTEAPNARSCTNKMIQKSVTHITL